MSGSFRATGLGKRYPGTVALEDVSIEVAHGEVLALLGENGAGKSTLASIVAGSTTPSSGSMTWLGKPYAPATPGEAMAAGIGMIHQELRLLPELTVAENVVVGRWPTRRGAVDRAEMTAQARRHLDRLGFIGRMDRPVGELSVAGQQQVEIAKALALDARLLILDEPTAALGHGETEALFETVRSLRAEGVSFIYVSHRLHEIARIADRIVVLRDGHVVAHHPSADVAPDRLVRDMVGRPVDRLFPERADPTGDVVLSVRGLCSCTGAFVDVDLDVRAGEIVGIAGIVGAGRTELVRAIAGVDRRSAGTVAVEGAPLRPGLRHAIGAGVVLVPEDRKRQGAVMSDTVEDNVALPNLDGLERRGWVTPRRVRALADDVIARLGVKGRADSLLSSLSGGNQQKVVLGKWLHREPKVVILDEPTRGVDVGARSVLYELIAGLARSGTAVVLVSSDLEEILGLSHRVLVLARGRAQGLLDGEAITGSAVIEMATR